MISNSGKLIIYSRKFLLIPKIRISFELGQPIGSISPVEKHVMKVLKVYSPGVGIRAARPDFLQPESGWPDLNSARPSKFLVTKQVLKHARVKRSWINKKEPKFNMRDGTLNAVLKTVFDFGITVLSMDLNHFNFHFKIMGV